MKDRIFLDSDIIVYAYGKFEDEDRRKREKAGDILKSFYMDNQFRTSTQAIEEFCATVSAKMNPVESEKSVEKFIATFPSDQVIDVGMKTIKKALDVKDKYNFSFHDSLVIASALDAGCTVLYSEDMCSGQTVGDLRIVNPLK